MSVIDLLITIIIVTILVTIGLGVVTYIAYKLRLARRPRREDEEDAGPRYFYRYEPDAHREGGGEPGGEDGAGAAEEGGTRAGGPAAPTHGQPA